MCYEANESISRALGSGSDVDHDAVGGAECIEKVFSLVDIAHLDMGNDIPAAPSRTMAKFPSMPTLGPETSGTSLTAQASVSPRDNLRDSLIDLKVVMGRRPLITNPGHGNECLGKRRQCVSMHACVLCVMSDRARWGAAS